MTVLDNDLAQHAKAIAQTSATPWPEWRAGPPAAIGATVNDLFASLQDRLINTATRPS
ncbi:hypothetical protein [Streptomyces sp. NPDC056468]|uniref:hypothetical protein n=1 Tax=Streptomyces sp. NPDC056468 TaxID=3345830 RepID=UPI0036758409